MDLGEFLKSETKNACISLCVFDIKELFDGEYTEKDIIDKAKDLNIVVKYSDKELEIIKENYPTKDKDFFEKHMPWRDYKNIKVAASKIGVHKDNRLTPEQIQFIIDYYPDTDTKEIAEELGKTVASIRTIAGKLKLKKNSLRSNVPEGYGYCPRCKEVLPAEMFAKSKNNKSGLNDYCRACDKLRKEVNSEKQVAKKKAEQKYYTPGTTKQCITCGCVKAITDFSIGVSKDTYYLYNTCKKCITAKNKENKLKKIKDGQDW